MNDRKLRRPDWAGISRSVKNRARRMRRAGSPGMANPGLQRCRIASRRKFFPQPPWTDSRRSGKYLPDPASVHEKADYVSSRHENYFVKQRRTAERVLDSPRHLSDSSIDGSLDRNLEVVCAIARALES